LGEIGHHHEQNTKGEQYPEPDGCSDQQTCIHFVPSYLSGVRPILCYATGKCRDCGRRNRNLVHIEPARFHYSVKGDGKALLCSNELSGAVRQAP
jgi:hypothetical protein